ncbi:hypothetical protein [Methyloversatilis discipulorum]|uniref:hypothetical protein n=1 Tax=Methyloversatilis discipulorum TaxID=1119528 RepID=UPI00037BD60F|nr:hypothetical protein [Methyloversatilis discipulorum]
MSISLLGAVKAVPWGDVIAAAPSVVQGANALWERVAKKRKKGEEPSVVAPPGASDDVRIAALEQAVTELQKEALASSQLIRTLAEQNAQLVGEIGALRLRVSVITIAGTGLLVFVVIALATMLSR